MRKTIWLLAGCMALAGCGDDAGAPTAGSVNGVNPSPTPTSTPSPTQGLLSTGEVKPTSDATFIAASLDLTTTGGISETNGIITGGMTSGRTTTIDTPQFKASYNSGYQLADTLNSASFGQAQLTTDTTAPNGNGTVVFTNRTSQAEDYLAAYQETTYSSSVKGMGYTTAQYGGIAGWQHTVVNGASRQTRLDYFGYGSATPIASMPKTGIVKFSLLSSGNYATDTDLWLLSAGSSNFLTVDFGAMTITGSIGLGGQNFYKNVVGGIGSLPLNSTFTGNSAMGSFTNGNLNTSGRVPGQFHILFIGPKANEVIVTFVANDGTQAAVGAAIGVIDPYTL